MVENERSVVNEPQGQTLITAEYFDTNVHMIRRHMCPQTMILLYYELVKILPGYLRSAPALHCALILVNQT